MALVLLVRSFIEGETPLDLVSVSVLFLSLTVGEVASRLQMPSLRQVSQFAICTIITANASLSGWFLAISVQTLPKASRHVITALLLFGCLFFDVWHVFIPVLLFEHVSLDVDVCRNWRKFAVCGACWLKGVTLVWLSVGANLWLATTPHFVALPSLFVVIIVGLIESVLLRSPLPVMVCIIATTLHCRPTWSVDASIWEKMDRKQKLILSFLLLTSLFTIIEFLTGLAANSLGLISDSFHMLLDSSSLAIGLAARFASRWKKSPSHHFGWKKYETLAGFVNGCLLAFVSVMISLEGYSRLSEPPNVAGGFLLFVSVCGLIVNGIGVAFFHEGCEDEKTDQNMRGVYLHILTDLLGSIGVIFSSLVIMTTGWNVVDPLCSLMIASLTFLSSLPLIYETSRSLRAPPVYLVEE